MKIKITESQYTKLVENIEVEPSKTTVNLATGPIILEENDYIFGQTAHNGSATLTLSILEINRNE